MIDLSDWYAASRRTHAAVVQIANRVMGTRAVAEILADLESGRLGAPFVQSLSTVGSVSLSQILSEAQTANDAVVSALASSTHDFISDLVAAHYLAYRMGVPEDTVFWSTLSRDLAQWGDFELLPNVRQRHLVEYAERQWGRQNRLSAAVDAAAESSEELRRPLGRPAQHPIGEPIDDWYRERTPAVPTMPALPPAPRNGEEVVESSRRRPVRGVTNGRSRANTVPSVAAAFGPRASARQTSSSQQQAPGALSFDSSTHWLCADTAGQVRQFLFSEMEDSHLYYTLEFLIDNKESLYQQYYRDPQSLKSLATANGTTVPEYWLKTRAAFGGLLREALQRGLTFPPNMVAFLTKNFAAGAPVRVATPWRTGAVQQEVQNLRSHVETYYTDQASQNAGQRAGRYMS